MARQLPHCGTGLLARMPAGLPLATGVVQAANASYEIERRIVETRYGCQARSEPSETIPMMAALKRGELWQQWVPDAVAAQVKLAL